MKIVRICLMLPLLLAAAFLSAGCTDKDGNYEEVNIQMSDVRLEGALYYIRRVPRKAIEIIKVDLDRGRRYVYLAPDDAQVVSGYRDGYFLVYGIDFDAARRVKNNVVAFVKEGARDDFTAIETGYLLSLNAMLSSDGKRMAFHGKKNESDDLTIGVMDLGEEGVLSLPCPGAKCTNPRWSSDDGKIFFIVDGRSVYYFNMVTGREVNFFSAESRGSIIEDVLSYDDFLIVAIGNERVRDGGSLVKVNVHSKSVASIDESSNCVFSSVRRTAMPNVIMRTKACSRPPSQGVYLYNLETGEEVRVSDPDWMAYGGGWSDK